VATNSLDKDERVKIGKQYEASILKMLNEHRPVVCHTVFDKWIEADEHDDMVNKIDAWAYSGLAGGKSVQIKYRETGSDLGIAVVRPYVDFETLAHQVENSEIPFDRDFGSTPDLYACLNGSLLMVVEGEKVKKGCALMMNQFMKHGGFKGYNGFVHANYRGAELRLVTDKGAGYSEGQQKIICYLAPSFIKMAGGYIGEV
jgi:hypothetical protein